VTPLITTFVDAMNTPLNAPGKWNRAPSHLQLPQCGSFDSFR
jgi:hypothetical protein